MKLGAWDYVIVFALLLVSGIVLHFLTTEKVQPADTTTGEAKVKKGLGKAW